MKKILFLSINLAFAVLGFSQQRSLIPPVKWYSFEDALTMNAERVAYGLPPKKLFVDVYTEWCGWCKRMDATTFAHPVIAEKLNAGWIPVKIDAERRDTVTINGQKFVNENAGRGPHQLGIILLNGQMSYPSYALIDEAGKPIQVVPGYQQPKPFEMLLDFFSSNAYRTTDWEAYQKTYQGLVREQ